MTRWFRMYTDVLDDPKVQRLPPDLFKAWVNLLCLAGRNDGVLPSIEDIAFALRLSQDVTVTVTADLVTRGLLDEGERLAPHNWAERQFKSDTPESATERKRAQRAREKERQKPENVTACHSDSHSEVTPPEQNRTEAEQNIEEGDFVVVDPKHMEVVQDILDNHSEQINHWQREFLISIKWKPRLTKKQQESFETIREIIEPLWRKEKSLPSVQRGSPEYDAWISHYRARNGGRPVFHEKLDAITVPTTWPPKEQAA